MPEPDADSLAAVRLAEYEAAAARLCREAASAMAAGNYDRARTLYEQAIRDYNGTECAATAEANIIVIDAITVVRERIHFDFDKSNIRDDAAAVLQGRADATVQYLVSLGLSEDMFSTVSYGKERPVAQGSDEDAWQMNRRSEFVIENMDAF
jgi:outer membrane protein OmpA-like peptidoglycan-associated protein